MTARKGKISVKTNDIFPIIKKWLYSEHDIFLRELISNATDAITKRETNARLLNQEVPTGKISVLVNPSAKTISITDNGLGMTESEVEKYIAQLAFSGAQEFLEKMKKAGGGGDIIGKFGLGFYSAFMVSDKVILETLSMNDKSKAVKWECEGDTEYTFSSSDKKEVGTTVTLYISEERKEFLNEYKVRETLNKFCDFMPYEISVVDSEKKEKPKKEDGTVDEKAKEVSVAPTVINNTQPLWKKDPSQLKDEDYKKFFRQLYPMEQEPLFWIHLKVDHPFTLEGILFFPKINPTKPFNEKNIKLYCKQVFVSDNVKDIIPEFLSLLKGAIDSSDIPLNVSRSSLQGDPNVRKVSNYVTKKVAQALKNLFKKDREKYEAIWENIGLFVKYGCISDAKFDELMRPYALFKNSDSKLITLDEYREGLPKDSLEKMKDKFIYFEKNKSDYTLRQQLKSEGIQTLETDEYIDPHFMQHLEGKSDDGKKYKFGSIDSEIHNVLETEKTTEEDIVIKELFENFLTPKKETKEKSDKTNPMMAMGGKEIEIQKIKSSTSPAYFKVDEQMKRFQKMTQNMGGNQSFPVKRTLVINPNNLLIQNALKIHQKGSNKSLVEKLCHHVEDLASISSEGLKNEEKEQFVKRSQDLISELSALAL